MNCYFFLVLIINILVIVIPASCDCMASKKPLMDSCNILDDRECVKSAHVRNFYGNVEYMECKLDFDGKCIKGKRIIMLYTLRKSCEDLKPKWFQKSIRCETFVEKRKGKYYPCTIDYQKELMHYTNGNDDDREDEYLAALRDLAREQSKEL